MTNFDVEAQGRFGNTDAYKEYEQKTVNYNKDKWQEVNNGLMMIFAKFAEQKKDGQTADADTVQALVSQLQKYITENYYTCTKEILVGLGQMYTEDERFKNNIDNYTLGTAEFVRKAIEKYCK